MRNLMSFWKFEQNAQLQEVFDEKTKNSTNFRKTFVTAYCNLTKSQSLNSFQFTHTYINLNPSHSHSHQKFLYLFFHNSSMAISCPNPFFSKKNFLFSIISISILDPFLSSFFFTSQKKGKRGKQHQFL